MKTLAIIRHAKSSWGDPELADHDRPLNARGRRVAPQMAALLATKIPRPDVILSSTATRARTTAQHFAAAFGIDDSQVVEDRDIYHAGAAALLEALRQVDEENSSAILVGHMPSVQSLTTSLCDDADIAHFPTCAVALIDLEIEHWGAIDPGTGTLREFLTPKGQDPPIE